MERLETALAGDVKVLHLLGDRVDQGGILSVIRNLQEAVQVREISHHAWVHRGFVESRKPALNLRRSTFAISESSSHLALLARAVPAFFELQRLLRKESFDVLHAHTRGAFPIAGLAARRLDRPVVFTNHTYGRRKAMYQRAARQKHFHTVLLTPNMARHYGLKESPPRITINSECCPDSLFDQPLVSHGAKPDAGGVFRLAGIGNVVRWKRWHLLIEAMAALPLEDRNRLAFDHWGPVAPDADSARYSEELRARIRRHDLGSRVRFHGPTGDVPDALRRSSWFVLPSTNEPCSVALIEALALGLPALVTSSGGNIDIVQEGRTGIFFEPDNPSSLAEALHTLLAGRLTLLSPGGIRDSVRSRSASAVAGRYLLLYRQLIPVKTT